MTVEIISGSISTKVWDQAGIKLGTPVSAVRHYTDCATLPNAKRWGYSWIFQVAEGQSEETGATVAEKKTKTTRRYLTHILLKIFICYSWASSWQFWTYHMCTKASFKRQCWHIQSKYLIQGLQLHPYFVYASSKGSDKCEHLCRLSWAFVFFTF